jgi:hypothetical protein
MGILDDAIREHLELKRKHGVSEQEVQRQEEEALGPARRDVAAGESQGENGGDAHHESEGTDVDEVSSEVLAADAATQPPLEAPSTDADAEPAGDEATAAESGFDRFGAATELYEPRAEEDERHERAALGHEPPTLGAEQTPRLDESAARRDEALEPEAEHPPTDLGSQASPDARDASPDAREALEDEPDDDELLEEESGPGGEGGPGDPVDDGDVLEDTPDFLQETPEHDRLWFEQKPPRDFDFD